MRALSASLCFSAALLSSCSVFPWTVSSMESSSVIKRVGEMLTMECIRKEKLENLYLYIRRPMKHELLFYHVSNQKLSKYEEYKERLNISVNTRKITITLTDLQMKDSGLYSCVFSHIDDTFQHVEEDRGHVFLFVSESCPESTGVAVPESLVLLLVVTACAVLLLCALAMLVWMGPKVKALCLRRGDNISRTNNAIYEDMHIRREELKD